MKDLKKKLKNIYFIGRYPEKDWHRLFVVFAVIGFLILCWSLYSFIKIRSEALSAIGETQNIRGLAETKEKELQQVLDRYQEKERRYKELQPANLPRIDVTSSAGAATTTSSGGASGIAN